MKQNDWIVENIENDLTPSEFRSIGLSTADTQLLPMETYLKSSYITDNPLFKNDDGTFSKDKFKDFYDKAALGFQEFSQDLDTFLYDLFDTARKADSLVRDPLMRIYQVSNPLHLKTGIVGRNKVSAGEMSAKEYAQQNKIYDPNTKTFLDQTVNDASLFRNPVLWFKLLFSDPIVYATYDDDGVDIDPITGQEIEHKAGDFKMNSNGEYYTEKLAGRSIRGKLIVSIFDNITPEGTNINKYDFFDADGFDKSVAGSLFSAAATVAPLFIPYVGEIYGAAMVGRELSKALPMLSGMLDSGLNLLGVKSNLQNNSLLNIAAAKGEQYTGGSSQYAQEHAFSFENFSKLVADVATLWGQLKIIAQGINKLIGSNKIIKEAGTKALNSYRLGVGMYDFQLLTSRITLSQFEKMTGLKSINELQSSILSGKWKDSGIGRAALDSYMPAAEKAVKGLNRIAADTSLAYMAIVSNTDVYQDLIDHGVTKGEAALFALASTVGMFGVDRTGIGELFFDELADRTGKFIPRNLDEMMKPWRKMFTEGLEQLKPSRIRSIIEAGKEFGDKYVKGYLADIKHHTTGFLGKAIGEGLEEVSEELVTDFTKSLYLVLGLLGITSLKDVGAWDNAFERYTMSALGGALGGSIFYGVGLVKGQYPLQQGTEDILYHIRNGKAKDYLKKVDEWEKLGKFGRTDLSTLYTEVSENGQIKRVYLTTDKAEDSQNHFIAQRVRDAIKEAEGIIKGEQINLSDDDLFDKLIISELRYIDMKDWLQKESYATNYYETYQNIINDIAKVSKDLKDAGDTKEGTPDGTIIENKDLWLRDNTDTEQGRSREKNLTSLLDKLNRLQQLKEEFLSDETTYYYTRKMLFALDPILSSLFFPTKFEDWAKDNGVEDLNKLSKADYLSKREEYDNWVKNNLKPELSATYDEFLRIEDLVKPILKELEGNEFDSTAKELEQIFIGEDNLINKYNKEVANPNLDVILEGESSEEFERYSRLKGSKDISSEDLAFMERRKNLAQLQVKAKYLRQILDIVTKGKLDPDSHRRLLEMLDTSFTKQSQTLINALAQALLERPLWTLNERPEQINPKDFETYLEIISLDPSSLSENQLNFKAQYEALIDKYNSQLSRILNFVPADIALNISSIIKNELVYNLDGSNNAGEIMQKIKSLIIQYYRQSEESEESWRLKWQLRQENLGKLAADLIAVELGKSPTDKRTEVGVDEYGTPILEKSELFLHILLEVAGIKTLKDGTPHNNVNFAELATEDKNMFATFLSLLREEDAKTITDKFYDEDIELSSMDEDLILYDDLIFKDLEDLENYIKNSDLNTSILLGIFEVLKSRQEILEESLRGILQEFDDLELNESINSTLLLILDELEKDNDILYAQELNNIAKIENPYIKFLHSFASRLGYKDFEQELLLIADSIDKLGLDNFRFSIELMEKFAKIKDIIDLANGYLYAASNTETLLTPYGHNHTVNTLTKKGAEDKLPEIDLNTAYLFLLEGLKYLQEIAFLEAVSNNNSANKRLRFIITRNNCIDAKLQLFKIIYKNLKFTSDAGDVIDLLENASINEGGDKYQRLARIEEVLYTNLQSLLSQGYTFKQILEKTGLLEAIITKDFDRLQTAKLDEEFKYEDFTSFDKFHYLMTVFSLNFREWATFLLSEITANEDKKIVPLSIQLDVARETAAFINNSNLWKTALDYIESKNLTDLSNTKKLSNSILLSGIGGSGKTLVGVKYAVDYLILSKKINKDKILITGSTDKVRQTLKKVIGYGEIVDKEKDVPEGLEIIKLAIDPATYRAIISDINKLKEGKTFTGSDYFTYKEFYGNYKIELKWDKIKLNDNAPELIVLDEATHLSSIELEILDKWATKGVILVGDTALGSYDKPGRSIDYESNFIFRTSKLGISLRDNNLLNLLNLKKLAELIERIKVLDAEDPNYSAKARQFIAEIKRLSIRGHNQEVLNGTIYSNVTKELIDKIQGSNITVAYLGSSTSENYNYLKSRNFKEVTLYNFVRDIQGSEFDYVIVDDDFLLGYLGNIKGQNVNNDLVFYYKALKDLYTVISRARVGSIIKDPKLGVNVLDKVLISAPPITDDLKYFTDIETNDLKTFLSSDPYKKEKTVKKKETTAPRKEKAAAGSEGGESSEGEGTASSGGKEGGGTPPPEEGEEYDTDTSRESGRMLVLPEGVSEDSGPTEDVVVDEHLKDVVSVAGEKVFPIYTSFTLLGAKSSLVEVDGEKYRSWTLHNNGLLRDMEIILARKLESGKTLTPLARKDAKEKGKANKLKNYNKIRSECERAINILKSAIIQNESWASVESFLSSYITKKQFEDLKEHTYIVVLDIDEESDILIGTYANISKENRGVISPSTKSGKAIKLVARTTEVDDNGDLLELTLGLGLDVSSDEKIEDSTNTFINILNEKINRSKELRDNTESAAEKASYQEDINKYTKLRDDVESETSKYVEAINKIESNGGELRVQLEENPPSRIQKFSGKEEEEFRTLENLGRNRALSVSEPFIYLGGLPGVRKSVKGKPVVFVSTDPSMSPESLPLAYVNLKKGIQKGPVRMLVLSGRGIHLQDLTRKGESTIFGRTVSDKPLPVTWNELGIKFLGAAWNFRANLLKFLDAYDEFYKDVLTQLGIANEADFYTLLDAVEAGSSNEKAVKLSELIKKFNTSLDEAKLRQFRLGTHKSGVRDEGTAKTIPTHEIKDIKVEEGSCKGIYIRPERATAFKSFLDNYFSMLETTLFEGSPINLIREDSSDPIQFQEDIRTLVSGEDNNYANIRSNVTKVRKDKMYSYAGTPFATSRLLTALALFTVRAFTRLGTETTDFDEEFSDKIVLFKKSEFETKERDKDEEEISFDINLILNNPLYKLPTGFADYRALFLLMIHGTALKSEVNFVTADKASDAYFKLGIFLNPVIVQGETFGVEDNFRRCLLDTWAFNSDATLAGTTLRCTPYVEEGERKVKSKLETSLELKGITDTKGYIITLLLPILKLATNEYRLEITDYINNIDTLDPDKTIDEILEEIKTYTIKKVFDTWEGTNITNMLYYNGTEIIPLMLHVRNSTSSDIWENPDIVNIKEKNDNKVIIEIGENKIIVEFKDISGVKSIDIKAITKTNVEEIEDSTRTRVILSLQDLIDNGIDTCDISILINKIKSKDQVKTVLNIKDSIITWYNQSFSLIDEDEEQEILEAFKTIFNIDENTLKNYMQTLMDQNMDPNSCFIRS